MRQTSTILYVAIDHLIPPTGAMAAGFDEFSEALDRMGVPAVWVSTRTRLQLDEPRRRVAHSHPFIAEDGAGVFLPSDYFHLKPEAAGRVNRRSGKNHAATIRLGRFTTLPVAEPQPAASEALESLAEDTRLSVVPLRSLPPRELAQNARLPTREAELARQRDFDELFFFAGASASEISSFQDVAISAKCQLRQRGALWSLAIGASVARCVRELGKLYDRALHAHARSVALITCSEPSADDSELTAVCDRTILLTKDAEAPDESRQRTRRVMEVPRHGADHWERVLEVLTDRR